MSHHKHCENNCGNNSGLGGISPIIFLIIIIIIFCGNGGNDSKKEPI